MIPYVSRPVHLLQDCRAGSLLEGFQRLVPILVGAQVSTHDVVGLYAQEVLEGFLLHGHLNACGVLLSAVVERELHARVDLHASLVFDRGGRDGVPFAGYEAEYVGADLRLVLVYASVLDVEVIHLPVDGHEGAVAALVLQLADSVTDVVEYRLEVELAGSLLELDLDVVFFAGDELPADRDPSRFHGSYLDEGASAEIDVARLTFRAAVHHLHGDFPQRTERPHAGAAGEAAVVLGVVHRAVEDIVLLHVYAAVSAVAAGHATVLRAFAGVPSGVACLDGECVRGEPGEQAQREEG